MKIAPRMAFAAALSLGAPFALANEGHHHFWNSWWHYDDRPSTAADDNTIHSGGATYADDELAGRVADALRNDRMLSEPGITATVVANNGRVSLTGSAHNIQQAARAEHLARQVAGWGNVSGTLESTAG